MKTSTFTSSFVAMLIAGIVGACQPDASPAQDQPTPEPAAAEVAAPAPAAAAPAKQSAGEQATAVYRVGPLDNAAIGALNQALGARDCVLATKPDAEQGLFEVTYRADQCCPNSLRALLAEVRPEVTLERAGSADPADQVGDHGPCGGCPYKNSCDKGGE